ncbi:terminase family protein [Blastococcus saxobsidens]|uniref:Terminase family protein n=2 Tax=Blastococcus saxobsidens TaxID=138336 RepID=A0A4Q7Y4Z9_9ACTN|nr:terminase family protein [Blastococcus saxobsidens]
MSMSVAELEAARRDPVVFADVMIGRPLWPHQVEVVRSEARYRVICAGRRAGKSHVYGVLALHTAFSRPGMKALIVSAGEVAAKRLFAEVSKMAKAPRLGGSTEDETTSTLILSNGSTIECVPSSAKQVRSAEADLLIVDEAGFVPQDIWESAEPVVLARPGSRVLLSSTPWGALGHFFRQLWRQGMATPDRWVQSWHWPSSVSPLVDVEFLEQIRKRSAPDYFDREYLAKWTDDGSAYFPMAELEGAVADYALLPPEEATGWPAVAGVDWGFKRDANALVLVSVLDDGLLNADRHPDSPVFFVPWLEQEHQLPYAQFVDRVVRVGEYRKGAWDGQNGYWLPWVLAEENGPGEPAVQALRQAARARWGRSTPVRGVWTTNRLKVNGYGALRLLIQQGRMVLPRHPELLKQLHALQTEMLPGGGMRIEVPDNVGHDDLADALMQCMASVRTGPMWRRTELNEEGFSTRSSGEERMTGAGTRLLSEPVPLDFTQAFRSPRAGDGEDDW